MQTCQSRGGTPIPNVIHFLYSRFRTRGLHSLPKQEVSASEYGLFINGKYISSVVYGLKFSHYSSLLPWWRLKHSVEVLARFSDLKSWYQRTLFSVYAGLRTNNFVPIHIFMDDWDNPQHWWVMIQRNLAMLVKVQADITHCDRGMVT